MVNHLDPYRLDLKELERRGLKPVSTANFEHTSGVYEYALIDEEHLANRGVDFLVAGMPDGQSLFISQNTEESLRSFYLSHEIECCRLRFGEVCRCKSIEEELFLKLSPELHAVMLDSRLRTFAGLIRCNNIDPEFPSSPFAAEIVGTHTWLEGMQRKKCLE